MKCSIFLLAILQCFAALALRAEPVFESVASAVVGPRQPERGALLRLSDGNFYGTSYTGGVGSTNGFGSIYQVMPDGKTRVMFSFPSFSVSNPVGGLVEEGNGNLWGTTAGGLGGVGTIFKYSLAAGTLTTVFSSDASSGTSPCASLTPDGQGNFWGTMNRGTNSARGCVFKFKSSTGIYTKVVEFGLLPSPQSSSPLGGLVMDAAGNMWGTATSGGVGGFGTIYRVKVSTGEYTGVVSFTGVAGPVRGSKPSAELYIDGAGILWGTTAAGGSGDFGTIFKYDPVANQFTTVAEFTGTSGLAPGSAPLCALARDGGKLWGTTGTGGTFNNGTIFRVDTTSGAFTSVADFTGLSGALPGQTPKAGLTPDGSGGFMGTTFAGGTANRGTVFRVDASTDVVTPLVRFTGGLPSDGAYRLVGG